MEKYQLRAVTFNSFLVPENFTACACLYPVWYYVTLFTLFQISTLINIKNNFGTYIPLHQVYRNTNKYSSWLKLNFI